LAGIFQNTKLQSGRCSNKNVDGLSSEVEL
jgi:hypothetical protein